MRKSFTRLLGLVMLFALLSSVVMAGDATKLWPNDAGGFAYSKTTDKIMVIYPEAVKASSGSVRLLNAAGTTVLSVLPANDTRISYAKGDTVVIDFSSVLKELTTYMVSIDNGAFKADKDGGTDRSSESWSFTTGDYTAPTIETLVPESGKTVSSNSVNLVITFKDASPIVMGAGKVTLYKEDGNLWDLIDVNSQGTLAGSVLTLTGVRTLEDNVNYNVTIDAGVVTDDGKRADAKKNSYVGLSDRTIWKFSSLDFSAPGFATDYPKKGTITNNSAAVLIKTNEVGKAYAVISTSSTAPTSAVLMADGAKKSVTVAAAGTEYSINFTGLSEATQYYIYVVTENVDGVVSTSVASVNPKTSETVAPTLAAVSYKKGGDVKATGSVASNVVTTASAVAQDIDNIVLDFSEEVKIGAGNLLIKKVSDNSVFQTIASTSLSVDDSDKSLVKVPVSVFENNTKYYITIPNTLILDVFDNKYSGITSTVAWIFTANDAIFPTFTYTPVEGASNVKKDAKVVLTFSELIFEKSGFDVSAAYNAVSPANPFELKVNNAAVAFTVSESTNDSKFTTFTITPAADFVSSAVVTVSIKSNSLSDIGGNVVDPAGQGIAFVVEDYVAPALSGWDTPAKPGDVAVAKFNEGIYLVGGGEITNSNLYTIVTVKETDANGANVAFTATIDGDKKKISITPTSPWSSEKPYYIAISSAIEDKTGNDYVGGLIVNTFTINDVTSASVDLSSVDGKTISTTAAVTLVFKEGSNPEDRASLYVDGAWSAYALANMNKVIIFKEGSATGADVPFTVTGGPASFGIVATLGGNNTYYLGIGASTKGTDGNVNDPKFVTFSTKFEGVPTVDNLNPADNSVQVDKGSNFVITFNTDVELAGYTTGDIYVTDGVTPVNIASGEITISGKVVTINPGSDLSNDKNYDIVVAPGVFKNKNSASVSGAIAMDAWDFATKDTKLDVISLTPDEVTNAAIDAKLKIVYGEKVKKGLGYIDIKNVATDALVERIDVVSAQVTLSGDQKEVTIVPSAMFSYNTAYYVEVAGGAFEDMVGNKSAAIFGKLATGVVNWTLTTDNPALAVVKVTPADGTDKVAADAAIVIEFNREIASVSGEVGYIEWKNSASQVQSYPFGSTNITISGKTLTITHPNKVFPADAEIFVYLPAGVLKATTDATKLNSLVDRTSTPNYSFYTGDVNAPKPTFTPAAFDSGNPVYQLVGTDVMIAFDEDIFNIDGTPVDNVDVNTGGLFQILDGATPVNFEGSITGKTVTLNPTTDLAEFKDYTIKVVANKIKDSKDHAITSDITSTFKTQDKSAPAVAFTLTGGPKKVTLSAVTVTDANPNKFYYLLRVKSSDAAPTAADIIAANNKDAASGTVSGFELSDLNPSTTYQLYYLADDKFGNTSNVAVQEASTDDTVAPLLSSTKPAAGDVDVNVATGGNVVVKLTFNEKVQAGTGLVIVRDYASQAVVKTYTESALSVVADDDNSLNLTLAGIVAETAAPVKLYVEISAGTITDKSTTGVNAYAGAFGMNTIYFTTEDNQAPTVNAGNSTNGTVALDTNIKVVFSEDVKAGSANLILYKGTVATANAIQVFTPAEAVFSGNTATVNPTADLANGQVYVVEVQSGFAKDLSSNANSNVLSSAVTFTGSTNIRPFVQTVAPDGGATALAKADLATITITFNEDIFLNVAGYSKSLVLLTQSELMSHIILKDGNGNNIAISTIDKNGSAGVTLNTSASNFSDQSNYSLTINGFEDNQGLMMNEKVVNYITSDGTAPTIVFNPAHKAENVNPAASLTLTFSENFYDDAINPNLNVFSYVDNSNVKNFVYLKEGSTTGADVTFTATVADKVITIVPGANLKSGVKYYYGLKRTVEDVNGQQIVLDVEGKSYAYFTAADYTIPKLLAINATNFAPLGTGAAAGASMWVKFDSEVVVSTGSVVIRREDGTIFQTVTPSGLSIDSNDKTKLKITHDDFEPFTNYFVEIQASTVVDKSGNPNALFNDPTPTNGWLFTTNDTYDLVATVTPSGDNTPRVVNLEMAFNKAPIGQGNKFIAVYKSDGTAIAQFEATALTVSGKTAIVPNIALDADQAYYARVESGAFKDGSGNVFAGIMDNSWEFSTINNISPKLIAVDPLSPANNATDVDQAPEFTATFDRAIEAGSGVISIRHKADGTEFTQVDMANVKIDGAMISFELPVALEKNTDYYIIVPAGAVTNTEITKDPFAGILNTYDWTFSTGSDEVAPTAQYAPNGPEAIDLVPADVALTMTFDERVMVDMGNLAIYNAADDAVVETIALLPEMLTDNVVTVMPTLLEEGMSYYVMVDAGAVKDLAGNDYEGIADKATWTFATGDFTAPVIVETTPTGTIEGNHPEFVITFNEDVMVGVGNLKVVKKTGDVVTLTIPVTAAMVSGNTVTVTYAYNATTGGLDKDTEYYVLVDAGALKDMAGNESPAIADKTAWTFKTGTEFSTEIDPKDASQFKVYPNPFVGFVNVDNAAKLSRVVVTNIAGQVVKEVVNPSNRIQLNELRSGIYFMSLYNTDNVIAKTAKIVKR